MGSFLLLSLFHPISANIAIPYDDCHIIEHVEKTLDFFQKTWEKKEKTSEIFPKTWEIFFYYLQHHRMRGGVVLHLFLSSLPAFPYFSPPLPVLHDASARVSFNAVTKGQG